MIIKSHIRGGFRAAADYLKEQGENEKIRTVQISDPDAKNLDQAFQNMWALAADGRSKKALHHISINPMKDEHLTADQVLKIVKRCEEKYGYKANDHQCVIVEHIKDGRQHFHVIWNRVSLTTGKVVKSGEHWKKSKQAAREMETELGLKTPQLKRTRLTTVLSQMIASRPVRPLKQSICSAQSISTAPTRPRGASLRASPPALTSASATISTARSGISSTKSSSPMSIEQRTDYIAACEGKITWRAYFMKWNKPGLLVIKTLLLVLIFSYNVAEL